MSKNRVAPLKQLTLPQFELMAALTRARLAHFIEKSFQKRFHNLCVTLWPDSQIVPHLLHSRKPLKPFIQSRVKECNRLHPTLIWHYFPTSDNTADLIARGITADKLRSSIWQHGPTWLTSEKLWATWSSTETATCQHTHLPQRCLQQLMTKMGFPRVSDQEYINSLMNPSTPVRHVSDPHNCLRHTLYPQLHLTKSAKLRVEGTTRSRAHVHTKYPITSICQRNCKPNY